MILEVPLFSVKNNESDKNIMIVRDIYDTRFSDTNKVLIKKPISEYSRNYENIYEGEYVNIPVELFNFEVDVLKPLSSSTFNGYNMIVFCK